MRKIILMLLMLSFGEASWCYNNTYAVIVGIADYKNDAMINDLPYTLNNTKAIYNFLISKKGGSVPKSNIYYLTDSKATLDNIIRLSKSLFAKAKEDDRVILYFGGHGGEGFYCPYDYDGSVSTMLFYSDIKSIFRASKSSTKLFFVDACFSGGIKTVETPGEEKSGRIARTSKDNLNIAVMSASTGDEISWQSGELGMGVFTYYLIKGLGGAANRDGNAYITIQELFYYVYKKVITKTSGPDFTSVQTPQLFGKFDLRLIVGKV